MYSKIIHQKHLFQNMKIQMLMLLWKEEKKTGLAKYIYSYLFNYLFDSHNNINHNNGNNNNNN